MIWYEDGKIVRKHSYFKKKCLANQILLILRIVSLIKKISFNKYFLEVRIVFSIRNYFLLCSWDTVYWQTIGISTYICNFYADILQIFWQTIQISATFMQIFAEYWQIINISAKYLQFLCRYFADILTDNWHICKYLQLLCRYFADMLTDNQHICKISATFMQIFCRYCRPYCSYAAVLQQIYDRYLQTFHIYVSLVRDYRPSCGNWTCGSAIPLGSELRNLYIYIYYSIYKLIHCKCG